MRLVTFASGKTTRIGVLDKTGERIVDLARAGVATDMTALIALGKKGLAAARAALKKPPKGTVVALNKVRLLAPFPRPRRNILCVGKNYHDHVAELNRSGFDGAASAAVPEYPIVFTKATTAVIGPGATIPAHLDPTSSVDYEGELVVVIGPGGRNIKKADAYKHVYGYTIANDVTSRTQQQRYGQWFLGKSLDGFCPMGPWLVTADEMGDVTQIGLVTRVNGEVRQKAKVSGLIFDIPTLIEAISLGRTLEAGDLIATGTPAGVGLGFKPPKFLNKGDVVTITFDRIGTLENKVG
ncbi:MAG: FAA hydrolase family protein [Rhodospirillales bacterium]|nr:FAA hydrolase family protein [Rhodospirillales bacterium]MSP80812.1 FAA hydrolase family protein [Rhodospirillales bacterium]